MAFDGLEHTLVKRWRLNNLMQAKWGAYLSSTRVTTPYLWASVITGVEPEKALKTESWVVPRNRVVSALKRFLPKRLRSFARRFLKIEYKWVTKEYLTSDPIFDQYRS